MAEKFPSLPDDKQRVFSLDLARFTADKDERAVVATGERGRITLFWSRNDGSWGLLVRQHDNLELTPRRADDSARFGWTRSIGVAAERGQVALAYKRRFTRVDAQGQRITTSRFELWIDLFSFNAEQDEFRGEAAPRRFPRESFDLTGFGWCVWADAADSRLHIVAQAFPIGAFDAPRLMLLQTTMPVADAATLEDASAWTVTDLDAGGWDFSARRSGSRLVVLHRRTAATYETDLPLAIDPGFGGAPQPITVRFNENPAVAPRTLSQMVVAGLVLVDVDLTSATVTGIDETMPFGENPQIHSVAPFIASVDRLADARVTIAPGRVRLRSFHAQCHLLMRTSAGWRTTLVLHEAMRWPRHLSLFARIQQGISLRIIDGGRIAFRMTWGALWTLRPIVLFQREETDKGALLTFGHQDGALCALRATTYRVFESDDGDRLIAELEAFTLLDITHRHIREPIGDEAEPVEYRQLRPLDIESERDHADGFRVTRREDAGNSTNGALVAHYDRPASFYAYTEMGDGGARVIFDGQLELPPPTATPEDKAFGPAWVAEPARAGRAWVRIQTPIENLPDSTGGGTIGLFVDTDLPGYFNPPTLLNPGSIVFDQQRALDGLAFAARKVHAQSPVSDADPLTFEIADGGTVRYRDAADDPGNIAFVSLTRESTQHLQDFILDPDIPPPPPAPIQSDPGQSFPIAIQPLQNAAFANETLSFAGVVIGVANPANFQFDWTFSDGSTDSGPQVAHDFQATRPDFSRPNTGRVRDDIEVTLTVTAPSGQTSEVSTSFALPGSLWAVLWTGYSTFRRAPDNVLDDNGDWQVTDAEWETYLTPGMFVRDAALSFYRYTLRYLVDDTGRGTRIEISNKKVHDGRYRFEGNDAGQGDTTYQSPIRAVINEVRLTGDFGGALAPLVSIRTVDARLDFRQRFTIGVQTSEQRTSSADSETVANRRLAGLLGPVITEMIPSALCCLPVEQAGLAIDELTVDSSLSAGGWALVTLLSAVIALVGTAALLVLLAPLLLLFPPAAATLLAAGALAPFVSMVIGAGLGALAALIIDNAFVKPFLRNKIQDALSRPETLASLREAGLFRYSGEGLAEALARKLIRQAQADGHTVADAENSGRDRMRAPFFETVVVSRGECKAELVV